MTHTYACHDLCNWLKWLKWLKWMTKMTQIMELLRLLTCMTQIIRRLFKWLKWIEATIRILRKWLGFFYKRARFLWDNTSSWRNLLHIIALAFRCTICKYTRCNTLHHTATHYSTISLKKSPWQDTRFANNFKMHDLKTTCFWVSTWKAATHCNARQHTPAHCNKPSLAFRCTICK